MNPTTVREHTRRTDQLAKAIEMLETNTADALLAGDNARKQFEEIIKTRIMDIRTQVVKEGITRREQIEMVEAAINSSYAALNNRMASFQTMTFWDRLRWLLTGKL